MYKPHIITNVIIYMSYDTKHGTECWEKEIVQNKYPSQCDKKIQSLIVSLIFIHF